MVQWYSWFFFSKLYASDLPSRTLPRKVYSNLARLTGNIIRQVLNQNLLSSPYGLITTELVTFYFHMLVWPKKDFVLFLLFLYSLKKDYKERPNYVSLLVSYSINDYLSWYIKIIPLLLICNDLLFYNFFISIKILLRHFHLNHSVYFGLHNKLNPYPPLLLYTKLFWPTGYLQEKSAYSYLFHFYISSKKVWNDGCW